MERLETGGRQDTMSRQPAVTVQAWVKFRLNMIKCGQSVGEEAGYS